MFNNKKSMFEREMFNQGVYVEGAPRIQGLQKGGVYCGNISDLENMSMVGGRIIPRNYSPIMPIGGSPVIQQVFQSMSGPNINPSIMSRQPSPNEIPNSNFSPMNLSLQGTLNVGNPVYDIYRSGRVWTITSKNHTISDIMSYDKAFEIVKKMIRTNSENGTSLLSIAKNNIKNYMFQKELSEEKLVYSLAILILNNLMFSSIDSNDIKSNEKVSFDLSFNRSSNEINGSSVDTLIDLCISKESNGDIVSCVGYPLGMNFMTSKIFLDSFNDTLIYPSLLKHNFKEFKANYEYVEELVNKNTIFFTSISEDISLTKVAKKIYDSIIKELNNGPIQTLLSFNVWVSVNIHGERLKNISIAYVSTERYVSSIIIPVDEEIMKSEDDIKENKCITKEEDKFIPVTFSSICYKNLKRDFNMFMSFMDFTIESYNSNEEGFKEIFKNIISDYDSIERFALDAGVELMSTVNTMIRSLNVDGFLRFTIKFDGNKLSLVIVNKVTGEEYEEIDLMGSILENGIRRYRKSYLECDQFDISSVNTNNSNFGSLMTKENAIVELVKNIILHDMEAYSKIYKIFSSLDGYCDGNIFESVDDIVRYIVEYGSIGDVLDIINRTYAKLNRLLVSLRNSSIHVELADPKGDTYNLCIYEYKESFITEELLESMIDSNSNDSLGNVIDKVNELATINGIENRDYETIKDALKKSLFSTMIDQGDRDSNIEGYIIKNYLNQYINGIDYELGNDGLIKVTFNANDDIEDYVRTISVYHILLLMKQN